MTTSQAQDPAQLVDERVPAVEGGSPAPGVRRRGAGGIASLLLQQYSLVLLLVLSILLYSVWSKTSGVFPTADNARNILRSQAYLCIITLGLLVPLVADQIDLSVGNAAGLASIACAASYSKYDAPLVVGVLIGVAAGTICGVVNGLIISVFRIPPFVTTLGTASVYTGVVDWYSGGQSYSSNIPPSLVSFGGGSWLGIPRIMYLVAVVGLLAYYLLQHTPFGRSLHAIGSNRAAAELVGIRVQRSIFLSFVISGFAAGVGGVAIVANSGAGNPQIGPLIGLTAIAAVFLGAASFQLGRVNVPGTLVGVYFIAVNVTGLTFAGASNWINELFTGLSLVLAIGLATFLSRKRLREGQVAVG